MFFQLRMIVVVEALDGRLLDRSVHPFDLSVGPGMLHLGQAMLDAVIVADPIEDVLEGISITSSVGELNAIVGQNGVNGVGHCRDQIAQELSGIHLAGFGVEFRERELGCSVNCDKEIELALSRLHLVNIDVEVSDRIAFELLLRLLVASDLRQT